MLKLTGTIILGIFTFTILSFVTFPISDDSPHVIPLTFGIISAISLLILIIATVVTGYEEYTCQIKDIESLQMVGEDKKIYEKKSSYLTEVFKTHLAEQYPQYERDIFSKLLPENVSAIATLFPDIKASKTITDYCSRISRLTDVVYDQDLKITTLNKNIRIRLRDRTGWWFLLPRP